MNNSPLFFVNNSDCVYRRALLSSFDDFCRFLINIRIARLKYGLAAAVLFGCLSEGWADAPIQMVRGAMSYNSTVHSAIVNKYAPTIAGLMSYVPGSIPGGCLDKPGDQMYACAWPRTALRVTGELTLYAAYTSPDYFGTTASTPIYAGRVMRCQDGSAPNLTLSLQYQCPTSPGRNVGKPDWCAGNPIDIGSGNKFQSEIDYRTSVVGGVSFERYYNSQDSSVSVLGVGWRHGYERHLQFSSALKARRPDGRVYTFSYVDANWVSDPDVTDRLVATTSGWSYFTADGVEEKYSHQGVLLSLSDFHGRTQVLNYNSMGRLIQITDSNGRTLQFTYGSDGHLASVQVPGDGIYGYQYTNGRLSRVTYPDGNIRQYRYEDPNHPNALTAILDGASTLIAGWTYDAEGRATSSVHADGADNTQVIYNADGTVTATNALGKQTTYHFTDYFGVSKVVRVEGHASADCVGANKSYTYDANGFLASKTDWNGITTTYTHDAQGRELSRTEAAGTPEARTVATEWHSQWRLPVRISEPGKVTVFTYDDKGQLLSRNETAAP